MDWIWHTQEVSNILENFTPREIPSSLIKGKKEQNEAIISLSGIPKFRKQADETTQLQICTTLHVKGRWFQVWDLVPRGQNHKPESIPTRPSNLTEFLPSLISKLLGTDDSFLPFKTLILCLLRCCNLEANNLFSSFSSSQRGIFLQHGLYSESHPFLI